MNSPSQAPSPTAEPRELMRSHLGQLAEKLGANGLLAEVVDDGFTAELVGNAQKPYLKVALANSPSHGKLVLARPSDFGWWWFWWSWDRPIGAVDDLELVVDRIAVMLRAVEAEL